MDLDVEVVSSICWSGDLSSVGVARPLILQMEWVSLI